MALRPTSLESALEETARAAEAVVSQAGKLAATGRKAQRAAEHGDLKALRQALTSLVDVADQAGQSAVEAAGGWAFDTDEDEEAYLKDGYQTELLEAAKRANLDLHPLEGALACYPSLVRVMPKERAVTIDRKPYRFIRPSYLIRHLKDLRDRPGKNNPSPFVESLYRAYQFSLATKKGTSKVASLADIYRILTLLPIAKKDYTQQEFARDLFRLQTSDVRRTNSGATYHFHAATGTKRGQMMRVIDGKGREHLYYAIEFIEPS